MARTSRLAKLSPPRMARLLLRPRLFRLLDRARKRRVLWIVAPPGSGKTALVASWLGRHKLRQLWMQLDEGDGDVATFFHYLSRAARRLAPRSRLPVFTPEFLTSPGGFARLFLRGLCAAGRSPAVIVLDDYHEIRTDSPLHVALRDGFLELPEGVTAFVLSRSEPPAPLARLRANGLLDVLRGNELALTKREAAQIGRLWGYSEHDRHTVLALHARTEGWVAGLVMLLSGWRARAADQRRGEDRQALFDYFAQEVLERSDPDTRRVLTETALLSRVEGPVAVRLTGIERAEEILASLARQGTFVVRHDAAYRYHALFREFLLGRLEKTVPSPERRAEMRRRGGALLEESGEIEDALDLYSAAGAWDDAVRVIRKHAPAFLHEGRAETVARWMARLPDEHRAGDPWILLWWGRALAFGDKDRAQDALGRAFDLFRAAGEATGLYLVLAAMAETFFFGLDDFSPLDAWISLLEDVGRRFPIPDPAVELQVVVAAFTAIVHRQPWHPALREWEERAFALALEPGDLGGRFQVGRALLIPYSFWGMDLARARLLTEAFRPLSTAKQADPASAILWHLASANLEMHLAHRAESLELVERGLAIAAESGLHAWTPNLLSVRGFLAVRAGDFATADSVLEQMAAMCAAGPRLSHCALHYLATMVARARENGAMALEHARIALEFARAAGSPLAEAACQFTWALAQPPKEAEGALDRALQLARRCGMRNFQVGSLLRLTLIHIGRGEEQKGLELLREALAIGQALGTPGFPQLFPDDLSECCALALGHGIEPEFVGQIIRAHRLAPCPRARDVAQWPWELRIEALQGFAVRRDGKPPEAGRKVQKKPQELLKLLVARGPGGMQPDALAERLWPDADGDAARQSLKVTLHRVRRLLGSADVVTQRDERVSLNPSRVFVDAWALGRLLDRLESSRTGPGEREALRMNLQEYRGTDHLADEDEDPFLGDLRRRLRGRLEGALATRS